MQKYFFIPEIVGVVAARHEASVSHTEDYSELSVCRLGNIFFNYEQEEDDIAVIGDCQTNLWEQVFIRLR